jgi:hypothetical protein
MIHESVEIQILSKKCEKTRAVNNRKMPIREGRALAQVALVHYSEPSG